MYLLKHYHFIYLINLPTDPSILKLVNTFVYIISLLLGVNCFRFTTVMVNNSFLICFVFHAFSHNYIGLLALFPYSYIVLVELSTGASFHQILYIFFYQLGSVYNIFSVNHFIFHRSV